MEKRVQSGGGGWTQVPARGARAQAKVPPGGGPGGGTDSGGRGAGEVGRGAGGRGGTDGAGNRPLPAAGGHGGRGSQARAFQQPRSFLPRANLEVRENTACLHMEGFQVLPTKEEFVKWLEEEVFKDELDIMALVLEGF